MTKALEGIRGSRMDDNYYYFKKEWHKCYTLKKVKKSMYNPFQIW
jgi:hypothetical protein